MNDMSNVGDLAELVKQIKETGEGIAKADEANTKRLEDLDKKFGGMGSDLVQVRKDLVAIVDKGCTLESSINDLWKRSSRPGSEGGGSPDAVAMEKALDLCRIQHELKIGKRDPDHPFAPSDERIKEALLYPKAFNAAIHTLDPAILSSDIKKSLSAFSFGTNSFMLQPEQTNRVLSCILYPTNIGGLFDSMTTSSPAVKFLIDNPRMGMGAWACEAACFANNPQPDLQEGLGELEIKPETIRYIVCATRDLIEDASINVENWIMGKVSNGLAATINNALILGDGVGKPMGVLNPRSGLPICETAAATPAGSLTWQDLVMLKWEIPYQWQQGASYLMNQRTFAQLITMTDAAHRPIWGQMPGSEPGFMLAGSPINIVTQMPDIAPGSTPVAFGNWKQVYMIVWRKAVTMTTDPYSAGFCILFKFEARVGGGILCPNAARLLRIR